MCSYQKPHLNSNNKVDALNMTSQNQPLNLAPVLTVGEFMRGQTQRPVIFLGERFREITYIFFRDLSSKDAEKVPFYFLRRKILDRATSVTIEEEMVKNIPYMVSIHTILEPILSQYPGAHRFF